MLCLFGCDSVGPRRRTSPLSPPVTTPIMISDSEICKPLPKKTTRTSHLSSRVVYECPLIGVELGIDFSHIYNKIWVVLNPRARIDSVLSQDADLTGPILFCFLIALLLLLVVSFRSDSVVARSRAVRLHIRILLRRLLSDVLVPASHER